MGDADPAGVEMYAVLKYGSKAYAFAAPSMVCPRLEWVGLSKAQLEDFIQKYPVCFAARLPPNTSAAYRQFPLEPVQKPPKLQFSGREIFNSAVQADWTN